MNQALLLEVAENINVLLIIHECTTYAVACGQPCCLAEKRTIDSI